MISSIQKQARYMCIKSIKIWSRIQKENLLHTDDIKRLILWEIRYIIQEELNISDENWEDNGRNYIWQIIRTLHDLIKNPDNEFKITIPSWFNKTLILYIMDNYPDSIF